MFALSLNIFSPNSTLLCWHNLLVMRFPQVVVPQNRRARISLMRFTFLDTASWLPFSFPNSILYQMHPKNFRCVPPKRSIPFLQLSVERIQGRWVLRYTSLDVFSHGIATDPWVPSSSTSRWGFSYHQLVEKGNDSHECICFQTCNHDTRYDVDNHTTICFILSTIDKEFSALVTGLAVRLFKLFRQYVSFTFGTEEYACSRWEFPASLHFIPPCPRGLPWHACVENFKRLFLNKTQLSSAENILQSSAQCKNLSPFCLVTALRSVIS